MKLIASILLIALLSFAACLFLPWWTIAVAAFIVSRVIKQKPGKSFFTGFISLFLLWGFISFWISHNNAHILAHRVSLLVFKMDNPVLLILVTALLGGIVAGFAALTGSYVNTLGDHRPSRVVS